MTVEPTVLTPAPDVGVVMAVTPEMVDESVGGGAKLDCPPPPPPPPPPDELGFVVGVVTVLLSGGGLVGGGLVGGGEVEGVVLGLVGVVLGVVDASGGGLVGLVGSAGGTETGLEGAPEDMAGVVDGVVGKEEETVMGREEEELMAEEGSLVPLDDINHGVNEQANNNDDGDRWVKQTMGSRMKQIARALRLSVLKTRDGTDGDVIVIPYFRPHTHTSLDDVSK
jgi:hypothetical protein